MEIDNYVDSDVMMVNREIGLMQDFDDLNIVKSIPQGCLVEESTLKYNVTLKMI